MQYFVRLLIPQSLVIVRHWELAQQEIISSTSSPATRALLAWMTGAWEIWGTIQMVSARGRHTHKERGSFLYPRAHPPPLRPVLIWALNCRGPLYWYMPHMLPSLSLQGEETQRSRMSPPHQFSYSVFLYHFSSKKAEGATPWGRHLW